MKRAWTTVEDDRLISIANDTTHRMSVSEIAAQFGRTEASVQHRAARLGCGTLLGRKRVKRAKKIANEADVIDAFTRLGRIHLVAQELGIIDHQVRWILEKHEVQFKRPNVFEEHKAEIIAMYLEDKHTLNEIGAAFEIHGHTLRKKLQEEGVYDRSRIKRVKRGERYPYRVWIAKYGQEEADIRNEAYCRKLSDATRGEKNPAYGKPSARGAGNGWKGWYRGRFFRSLREAAFMIKLDEEKVSWVSGESKGYVVPYRFEGRERTYRPDFVAGTTVYELKPTRLHHSPNNLAKQEAAKALFAARGMTYVICDIEIDYAKIDERLKAREIRFMGDYETRFIEYRTRE